MSDLSPVLAAVTGLVTGITSTIAAAIRLSSRQRATKQDQVTKALVDNATKSALLTQHIGQLGEAVTRLSELTIRIETLAQARQGNPPDDAPRPRTLDESQRLRAANRVRAKIGRATGSTSRVDPEE